MSQLSRRLRELREEKELRQEDVANYARITIRSYQKYEGGEQEPTVSRLAQLASILNVSMDYLVGMTDDRMIAQKDGRLESFRPSSNIATVLSKEEQCRWERPPTSVLPERLKSARREKKLRQTDVAKAAGIAVRSYQHYETGSQEPTASRIMAIAKALSVSIDALVGQDVPAKERYSRNPPREAIELSTKRFLGKLPSRILQARRKKGISLKEAAESVGTTAEEYRRYEEGQETPSVARLVMIAIALDASMDFLVGRTTRQEVNR